MDNTVQQSEVNEVPMSESLQQAANKFLRAVKDNQWDDNTASTLVLVFRSNGNGGVDVNALNQDLGDEYQKLMTDAALKAISGKPLFYIVE
jgi:hypothetical protein